MRTPAFFLCLFISAGLFAQSRADQIRARLLDPSEPSVLVAAHRADWRYAPENSIEAIESAIELGADIVEIDVHKTIDGKLIVMHNYTLSRTTDGFGLIALRSYKGIRKLTLQKNGKNVEGTHVPTLEEALLAAKGKILVNLDKAFSYFDETVEIARRTGTLNQIIFKSAKPAWEASQILGDLKDSVLYMPVVRLDKATAPLRIMEYEKLLHPPVYELNFATEEHGRTTLIRDYLRGESRLWYNSLWDSLCGGHTGDYPYLVDTLNAGVIQSDDSEGLLRFLKERK